MATFKDRENNEWELTLTYGSASAVKGATGVNLAAVSKSADWVDLLFSDPENLVKVLWVMVADQAEKKGVTAERFGYGFDGPALERAGAALGEAIADFFPRSRIAKAIREGLPKVLAAADEKAVKEIEKALLTASSSVSNSPA